METFIAFPEQPSVYHTLKILRMIGQGNFEVFHTYCPFQKTHYALKVFPKTSFGTHQYQKEAVMSTLSHPNIIKHIPAITAPENNEFYTILTEFAQYGDLFDLVLGGLINSEILIRTYFHQLIAGLEYMHSQGIAHLDLKLENLMLGSDFTLKIIDFDQAQKTTDKRITSGSTRGFRAPEVINGSCQNLVAADIYSAGVLLYAFKAQEYPFVEMTVTDQGHEAVTLKYYSTFIRNNKKFWEAKSLNKKDAIFFSKEFQELINGMLEYRIEKRLTIQQIKESKWYNGPVLDSGKLKIEMEARWKQFSKN